MKPHPLYTSLLPPALLVALTATLLFVLLRTLPVWMLDIGSAGDTYFVSGLLPTEYDGTSSFRWSQPATQLRLYGASDSLVALTLRLHGDQRAEEGNQGLIIAQDDRTIAAFDMTGGWRIYQVLLPHGALVTPPGRACQGLEIACLFPRAAPLGLHNTNYQAATGDTRQLGVSFDWVAGEPLTPTTPTTTLLRTLLLMWAVALLTGVLWRLDTAFAAPPSAANQHATGLLCLRSVRVCLLAGTAALALLVWAHWKPYTLAWAVQSAPPALLLVTVLLLLSSVPGLSSLVQRLPSLPRLHLALPGHLMPLAIAVLAHLVLLLPLPMVWHGIAAHIVLALPGVLLALRLFGDERDLPDDAAPRTILVFLGLCGALMLAPLVLLVLQAVPGPLPWWLPLIVCDGATVALLLRRGTEPAMNRQETAIHHARPGLPPLSLLLVLALGSALRLPFLGSAEFQGDEGNVILMAAAILHGHDEVLMLHRKGPLEVLLVAGPLVLTGHLNELIARLPFAVAGVGVLLGCYLLGQRIVHCGAGRWALLATTVLALDGFLVAFSRIVQYQSVVLVMSMGALWCCWRFYEGVAHYHRYLISAALMIATGLLAHYDTIFITPALAWLVLMGGRQRSWSLVQWTSALAVPVVTATVLLTSFFLPFVTHERFARTTDYLAQRLGESEQVGLLFNNLIRYYPLATYYNTTFQMIALAAALLTALLAWLWIGTRPRPFGWLLAALLLLGSVLMVVRPAWLVAALPGTQQQFNWSILAFGLPLLGLLLSPAISTPLRLLLLWFTPPFLAMSFLIARPNTHFYAMHTAAALLIGLAVMQAVTWLRYHRRMCLTPLLLTPLTLGGALLLLVSVPYLVLVYVRQMPEYRRTFPDARPGIYLASYGDTLPDDGSYFGFTHRDGWKVIGELYRQEVLQGDYDSNQKSLVTGWYTRGAFRCGLDPEYYIAARAEPYLFVPNHYHLWGYVTVDGNRSLDIYTRERSDHPLQVFALHDYVKSFDAVPVPHFPMQRALAETLPQYRLDTTWQGGIRLHGYDLDRHEVAAGQSSTLLLSWQQQALRSDTATMLDEYEPVVILRDDTGSVVSEAAPFCDTLPLSEWDTREVVQTAFAITNTADMRAGRYTIYVGFRHRYRDTMLPMDTSREQVVKITNLVVR